VRRRGHRQALEPPDRPARHFLGARGAGHLRQPHRPGEPRAAAGLAQWLERRALPRGLPRAARARRAFGRQALRRRAADAGHRARPAGGADAPAPRRALGRPRAGGGAADRTHPARAEAERPVDAAGRVEPAFRALARRPARPHRRRRGEGEPDGRRGAGAGQGTDRLPERLTFSASDDISRSQEERNMKTSRILIALLCAAPAAFAQKLQLSGDAVKIGLLTDMNGVYSAISGPGALKSAEMAADGIMKANTDFAGKAAVVAVDHQNKADIATNKANEMFERQEIDLITDNVNSATALAIASVTQQRNKLFINTGAGTSQLTNENCNHNTFHYAYDNYMLANGTGTAVTKQGGKTWYMIYPNYAFGQNL